jgi:hypothetical protein
MYPYKQTLGVHYRIFVYCALLMPHHSLNQPVIGSIHRLTPVSTIEKRSILKSSLDTELSISYSIIFQILSPRFTISPLQGFFLRIIFLVIIPSGTKYTGTVQTVAAPPYGFVPTSRITVRTFKTAKPNKLNKLSSPRRPSETPKLLNHTSIQ